MNNTFTLSDKKKYGGHFYISGSDMIGGGTEFYDLNSDYSEGMSLGGGALYCSMCNVINIQGSKFRENYAKNGGALIVAYDLALVPSSSLFTIDGCEFMNNYAT